MELTHLRRAPIDAEKALREHAAYRAALQSLGATLIDIPADDGFPDCAFVEDALLAFPECFVLCRPGAPSRRGEADALLPFIPHDRPLHRIAPPGTIDGGDILCIGRAIFAGLSTRTNDAGIEQLTPLLAPCGYSIKTIHVGGALHLKTAVTAPRLDTIVLNPDWISPAAFADFTRIDVDPAEPFAANTLCLGNAVLISGAHPRTAARLAHHGIETIPLAIAEFEKAEAGLTCLSVAIPGPTPL